MHLFSTCNRTQALPNIQARLMAEAEDVRRADEEKARQVSLFLLMLPHRLRHPTHFAPDTRARHLPGARLLPLQVTVPMLRHLPLRRVGGQLPACVSTSKLLRSVLLKRRRSAPRRSSCYRMTAPQRARLR
jgi:hypothetical protein